MAHGCNEAVIPDQPDNKNSVVKVAPNGDNAEQFVNPNENDVTADEPRT